MIPPDLGDGKIRSCPTTTKSLDQSHRRHHVLRFEGSVCLLIGKQTKLYSEHVEDRIQGGIADLSLPQEAFALGAFLSTSSRKSAG
jgi:hypothetical protein